MKLQHERDDKMVQQQQVRDDVLNQAVAVSVTVCVSQVVVRMAQESGTATHNSKLTNRSVNSHWDIQTTGPPIQEHGVPSSTFNGEEHTLL